MNINFSLDKLNKIAEELDIELEFNSDNPGHFVSEGGIEKKISLKDVFPEVDSNLFFYKEEIFTEKEDDSKFSIHGVESIQPVKRKNISFKSMNNKFFYMSEALVS
ncbi:hypothetical protein INQ56_16115 [Bacillus altitudinis]|uniref:hypothetical protein n=1 Tax=Bacillus altitudinis TaxID=293387 RepID=UPI0013C85DBD|nr:hypothetical protein [Bacillus altitudinis]MDM5164539.1 hypothetical protein [Bacillus altitudinis]NEU51822.1 hypothetical protein [Bacillus altitudinis]QOV49130.1 hypothetical protein INQ56_16115 [Bacillus altitudinis]